ncbi:MAG TPA: FHA domain-containing protein, partial [Polyangia bacterium]|nr:FHA domain-containing protein [Polyangia bacterium]
MVVERLVVKRHAATQTEEAVEAGRALAGPPQPGLVLVFSAGRPLTLAIACGDEPIDLGREAPALATLADPLLSRRHARVSFADDRFTVHDLGSRNGTTVDGERVAGVHTSDDARVLRVGSTIALFCHDIRAFAGGVAVGPDVIMGPRLRGAWDAIGRAARAGSVLHVSGESGVGKELAARAFHHAGANAGGPFVAVNCAAIPEGVAERLLFGAR